MLHPATAPGQRFLADLLAGLSVLLVSTASSAQTLGPATPRTPRLYADLPRFEWPPYMPKTIEAVDAVIGPPARSRESRVQLAFRTLEIGAETAWIEGLSFRHPSGGSPNPAARFSTEVVLSHSKKRYDQMSAEFAKNPGPDATQVFKGTVSWPRVPYPPPRSRWIAHIAFQRPFRFVKSRGPTLLIDLRTRVLTPTEPWWVVKASRDLGNIAVDAARHGCWLWKIRFYYAVVVMTLYPGGTWNQDWYLLPPSTFCITGLGTKGAGQWWGPYQLPIDLGAGCGWAVPPLLLLGFRTNNAGFGKVPRIPIPNDPRLANAIIYSQTGCFTPGLNSIGFVTTFSTKYRIGSGKSPRATTVSNSWPGALKARYGFVFRGQAAATRLWLR